METNIQEITTTQCPPCGQESNNNADECTRGFDAANELTQKEVEQGSHAEPAEETSNGASDMLFGALWCIGGIVVTAATYSAVKDTGGTYIVAWGAIIFGGYQFFKGLIHSLA
jgi:hypothetical protein